MGRKFKPGESGNPDGGRFTVEVRTVLNDYALNDNGDPIIEVGPDGKKRKVKRLRKVAEAWVREAMKGNMQAIEKLADRMDGKVKEVVKHEGDAFGALWEAIQGNARVRPDDAEDDSPTIN